VHGMNIDDGGSETNGVRNPDGTPTTSIGLFQQQDSWGTPQERIDPTTAATLFYDRLILVEGWATNAAHPRDPQGPAKRRSVSLREVRHRHAPTG